MGISRLECICIRVRKKPRRKFWRRMMPGADALIRRLADSVDVRLRRMRYRGNIPTERVIETLREHGAQLPALKPLDVLLRATDGLRAKYSSATDAE